MAIRIHDLYHKIGSELVYDWRPESLNVTLQFCKQEEKGERVNPHLYQGRVYSLDYNRTLHTGSYEECKSYFCKHALKGEYMQVQIQVAPKGWGMETVLDNKDDYYKWRNQCRWAEAEKRDRSSYWRAGDARWEAPGMSVRDFI